MATIRIKGCKIRDIENIAKTINAIVTIQQEPNVENLIVTKAIEYSSVVISKYDISSCKTIINVHAKGNMFEAIKKSNGYVNMENELLFYRQLATSYIIDIIYKKIHEEVYLVPIIVEPIENRDCSICLDAIINSNRNHLTITKCNHYFHKSCINNWIRIGRGRGHLCCPNCRARNFL